MPKFQIDYSPQDGSSTCVSLVRQKHIPILKYLWHINVFCQKSVFWLQQTFPHDRELSDPLVLRDRKTDFISSEAYFFR